MAHKAGIGTARHEFRPQGSTRQAGDEFCLSEVRGMESATLVSIVKSHWAVGFAPKGEARCGVMPASRDAVPTFLQQGKQHQAGKLEQQLTHIEAGKTEWSIDRYDLRQDTVRVITTWWTMSG